MTEMLTFEGREVRMFIKDGNPWWVASDVCEVLGIKNSRDALAKSLRDSEKGVDSIYTLGGNQEVSTVNEAGLYKLIFKSRKPEAERFQDWVTGEVLPMIRRHGIYAPEEQYSLMQSSMQLVARFAEMLPKIEARLDKLEETADEAHLLTAELPEPFTVLPGFTNADSINRAARAYCKLTGFSIGAVMSLVYNEVEFRYKIRISARKKRAEANNGFRGSTLRFAIENGWGEYVYTVIHAMIQRAIHQRAA